MTKSADEGPAVLPPYLVIKQHPDDRAADQAALQEQAALALHSVGLDPSIGYYHQLAFSRESLASDLVETIRPLCDRFCLHLISRQTLTADHFSTSKTAGCLLGKAGRKHYYLAYEETAAPTLRRALQKHIKTLIARIDPNAPEPSIYTPEWIPSPHQAQPPEEQTEQNP